MTTEKIEFRNQDFQFKEEKMLSLINLSHPKKYL